MMTGSEVKHPRAAPTTVFHGARSSVLTVAQGSPARMKACTEHEHIDRWATAHVCPRHEACKGRMAVVYHVASCRDLARGPPVRTKACNEHERKDWQVTGRGFPEV